MEWSWMIQSHPKSKSSISWTMFSFDSRGLYRWSSTLTYRSNGDGLWPQMAGLPTSTNILKHPFLHPKPSLLGDVRCWKSSILGAEKKTRFPPWGLGWLLDAAPGHHRAGMWRILWLLSRLWWAGMHILHAREPCVHDSARSVGVCWSSGDFWCLCLFRGAQIRESCLKFWMEWKCEWNSNWMARCRCSVNGT